jgi:hypothetical protein
MWMTAGRQCRHCSLGAHKRCEEKLTAEHICTPQSTLLEDDPAVVSTDPLTALSPLANRAAAAALSVIETATIRSLRTLTSKNLKQLPTLSLSELMKTTDQTGSKPSGATSPGAEAPSPSHSSSQTSFKLANAASSAYSKLFEPKSRRTSAPVPSDRKKIIPPLNAST